MSNFSYIQKFQKNIVNALETKEKLQNEISGLKNEINFIQDQKKCNEVIEKEIYNKVKKLNSVKGTILMNESLLNHLDKDLKEYKQFTLKNIHDLLISGSFQDRAHGRKALIYLTNLTPDLKLFNHI